MIMLSVLVILKMPSGSDMVSTNTIHVSHMLVAGLKQQYTYMIVMYW